MFPVEDQSPSPVYHDKCKLKIEVDGLDAANKQLKLPLDRDRTHCLMQLEGTLCQVLFSVLW